MKLEPVLPDSGRLLMLIKYFPKRNCSFIINFCISVLGYDHSTGLVLSRNYEMTINFLIYIIHRHSELTHLVRSCVRNGH